MNNTRRKAMVDELVSETAAPFWLRKYRVILLFILRWMAQHAFKQKRQDGMKKWFQRARKVEVHLAGMLPPSRRELFQQIVRRHGTPMAERRWLWAVMTQGGSA